MAGIKYVYVLLFRSALTYQYRHTLTMTKISAYEAINEDGENNLTYGREMFVSP